MEIDKSDFENYLSEKLRLYEEQTNQEIKNISIIQKEDFEGNMSFQSIKIEVE
jgi:hypothetical protein